MLTPHETLYKKGQNKLQINVNILNLHLDKKKKKNTDHERPEMSFQNLWNAQT